MHTVRDHYELSTEGMLHCSQKVRVRGFMAAASNQSRKASVLQVLCTECALFLARCKTYKTIIFLAQFLVSCKNLVRKESYKAKTLARKCIFSCSVLRILQINISAWGAMPDYRGQETIISVYVLNIEVTISTRMIYLNV